MITIEILNYPNIVSIFSKVLARLHLYSLQMLRRNLWFIVASWISLDTCELIALLTHIHWVVWMISFVGSYSWVFHAVVQGFKSDSCTVDLRVFLVSASVVFVAELIWVHVCLWWNETFQCNVLTGNWLVSSKTRKLPWVFYSVCVESCSLVSWTQSLVRIRSAYSWSLNSWRIKLWSNAKSRRPVITSHLYRQIFSVWILSNYIPRGLLTCCWAISNNVCVRFWQSPIYQHLTNSAVLLWAGREILLVVLDVKSKLLFAILIIIRHLSSVCYICLILSLCCRT